MHAKPQDAISASASLTGRYMLQDDQSEHACQVESLTLEGAIFKAKTVPAKGKPLIAYIEELGRVEAVTNGAAEGGFSIRYSLQGARLERLQQKIGWLLQHSSGERGEMRRNARYEPVDKALHLTMPDGRVYPCEALDISTSGAGIKTDIMPAIGSQIMLGKMRARVVRYLDEGIAIEFITN